MNATATPTVCLITPGHLASAPRVVKEADALAAAGYRTHVVCGRSFPAADKFDADIFATAQWSHTKVDFTTSRGSLRHRLLRRAARFALGRLRFTSAALAARALHAEPAQLAAAAGPATLYVGHCLAGLAAVSEAAARHDARYGFDAEDLHDEETNDPAERAVARALQSRLLRGCVHRTVSSPLIGAELQRRYGTNATTVLNVFPLAHAPTRLSAPPVITSARPARIYWFSQTIGPGRGLETAVAILARMRTPVELNLRGFAAPGYVDRLQAEAARAGLVTPIKILPPGSPAEMARLAAEADLGLSLEERAPLNRDLCLTNKLFVYLLAGIPQLLANTSAQATLAPELRDAALLCDPNDPAAVARQLDEFFAAPARVAAAREAATRLARERFCWDVERDTFLAAIATALSSRSHALR